jgi:hypothetical protein
MRLRTTASHKHIVDTFDVQFEKAQKELLVEAYGAVNIIRQILAKHPDAKDITVPNWLLNDEIRIP